MIYHTKDDAAGCETRLVLLGGFDFIDSRLRAERKGLVLEPIVLQPG